MNQHVDFTEVFANKFNEIGIAFGIDESPVSEEFAKYAGDLIGSWVSYAVMHEEPEAFMMMLNEISKMRRIDHVGLVAMTISGQGYNPYGEDIPAELDAIMGVINAQPSIEIVIETFNELGHSHAAYIEGEIVRFKEK